MSASSKKVEFASGIRMARSGTLPIRLHLVELVASVANSVFQVFLFDGCKCAENNQLKDEVCERAQDHEVMQTSLNLAHL